MAYPPGVLEQPSPAVTASEVLTYLWRKSFGWLVILLLLVLEYGLFRQSAQREVTWAYPANHDQAVFLGQSYETYEKILDDGLRAGLWHGFNLMGPENTLAPQQKSLRANRSCKPAARRTATGALMHLQAALLFLVLGPSRLSALTLNFLYFGLLQIILAWTLHWLTRRWSVALMGVGLLLTVLAPFYYAGGLLDFRSDFIAFCLYGMVLCLVLRSGVFASRRWSLVAGLAAAWLVLFRFITAVYLTGIAGVLVPYFCGRLLWRRHDPAARHAERRRLTGLLVAGLVLVLVTGPVLWHRREAIRHYYVIGHITGQEKHIRDRQFATDNPFTYYPHSLLVDHTGPLFLGLCALTLGGALLLGMRRRRDTPEARCEAMLDLGPAYVFLGASLGVPLFILSLNMSRSPVVANIAVAPLVCLVLLSVAAWTGLHRAGRKRAVLEYGLAILAGVAFTAGIGEQLAQHGRRTLLARRRADSEQVLRLYDEIGKYCRAFDWKKPRISTTSMVDYLNFNVARVLLYERQGLASEPQPGLGSNMFAVTKAEALEIVRQSDFVIVARPATPQASVFPFDKCMQRVTPEISAFCKRHFTPLQTFHLGDADLALFVRPALKMEGDSGGWITSHGVSLRGTAAFLRKHTQVRLEGTSELRYLDKMPSVRARLLVPGRTPRPVQATLTSHGQDYLIELDVNKVRVPAETPVEIRLAFDSYFVPQKQGLGNDRRRLVIRTPAKTELLYH